MKSHLRGCRLTQDLLSHELTLECPVPAVDPMNIRMPTFVENFTAQHVGNFFCGSSAPSKLSQLLTGKTYRIFTGHLRK